jgi:hypothetical protein
VWTTAAPDRPSREALSFVARCREELLEAGAKPRVCGAHAEVGVVGLIQRPNSDASVAPLLPCRSIGRVLETAPSKPGWLPPGPPNARLSPASAARRPNGSSSRARAGGRLLRDDLAWGAARWYGGSRPVNPQRVPLRCRALTKFHNRQAEAHDRGHVVAQDSVRPNFQSSPALSVPESFRDAAQSADSGVRSLGAKRSGAERPQDPLKRALRLLPSFCLKSPPCYGSVERATPSWRQCASEGKVMAKGGREDAHPAPVSSD